MSSDIIKKLEELQEDSNKDLIITVISKIQKNSSPRTIAKPKYINNKLVYIPTNGASSLLKKENTYSRRKTKTFSASLTQ